MAMLMLVSTLWLMTAQAAAGAPPVLEVPAGCVIGRDCLVQKLVDRKPGEGRQDYRCGTLVTEEHDGVDIRVRTLKDMEAGVDVLAAAPGRVLRVRDGMADVSVRAADHPGLNGRQAGNGVVIDHGNGWETQYSHMRQGSIAVRPGDVVRTGQPLGKIGMSGNAEFPHLHFEVRHNGRTVDPFLVGSAAACSARADGEGALWSPAARKALAYRPTDVITIGFATGRPDRDAVRMMTQPTTQLPTSAPALVLWADAFGVRAGDVQEFRIEGPGGKVVHEQRLTVDKPALSWFAFSGKRRPPEGWPAGVYTGSYRLLRDGAAVAQYRNTVTLR